MFSDPDDGADFSLNERPLLTLCSDSCLEYLSRFLHRILRIAIIATLVLTSKIAVADGNGGSGFFRFRPTLEERDSGRDA